MRTIEVPDALADALEARARQTGLPLAEWLSLLATGVADDGAIQSHPEVMGGDDCVRGTRIPVWILVSLREQGETDVGILESYPQLTALDLSAAWDHFARHSTRILSQRARHDDD